MSGAERTLVLLRHGESVWNRENRFTGWTDVPLTDTGREQARRAGARLRAVGIVPTAAHTSVLVRAIRTLEEALSRMDCPEIAVRQAWELNERHYGALQGKDKAAVEQRFGAATTLAWRRGFDRRPPEVAPDDPRSPKRDPRYAEVPPDRLPLAESLADTRRRVVPYWERAIVPDLRSGPTLVVAHGNSLRALVMHLDGIAPEDIERCHIPTGIPLAYRLDEGLGVIGSRYLAPEAELAAGVARAAGRP